MCAKFCWLCVVLSFGIAAGAGSVAGQTQQTPQA